MSDQGPLEESDDQQFLARVTGISINNKRINAFEGPIMDLDIIALTYRPCRGFKCQAKCKLSSLSVCTPYNIMMNRRVAYNKYSFNYMPHIIISHPPPFAQAVLRTQLGSSPFFILFFSFSSSFFLSFSFLLFLFFLTDAMTIIEHLQFQ